MNLKLNQSGLKNFYIPLLLFLITFGWKFFYIGVRDICIDEPFTIFNAQRSLKEILLLPTKNEPNPPLFMVILHFWIKLFGISPYAVRIVPLFFNALTPVFLYLTAKKLVSFQAGILAAGLFILSSYQFYFGMETRTYSLLLCATSAAIWFLFSLFREPSRRIFQTGLIIANVILVYSHYFGWFVVFMEIVSAWILYKNRIAFRRIFISVLYTGLAFLPMVMTLIKQFFLSKEQTWVQSPAGSVYWSELIMFMNHPSVIHVVLGIIVAGIIFIFFSGRWKKFPLETGMVFIFWAVPYTLMFLVSSWIPMFENRYVMYNSIGLYLFTGLLTGYLYDHRHKWVAFIPVMVILYFMGVRLQIRREFIAHREVKQAVEHIKSRTDSSYLTIVYPHWNDYEFAYYYNRDIFKDVIRFEARLRDSMVYQVWGLDDAKMYAEKFKDKKIALFKGGREYNEINQYLDKNYIRLDSAFFPDCYYLYFYEPVFPDKETQEPFFRRNP